MAEKEKGLMAGSDPLLFDNQICFSLYSAANAVVRAYRPLLKDLDLTYLQYMTLMLLWESSPRNVKELGEHLGLDSGTLTPLLKRLEAKGLVTRGRDEKDERVRVITITRQGMALRAKAADVPHQLACSLGLEKSKALQIKQSCQELLAALNEN